MMRNFTVEQEQFVACFLPAERKDILFQLTHHFDEDKNPLKELAIGTSKVLEGMDDTEFKQYQFEIEL